MSFLNFLIALSPIIVVLVGILAFHQSAKKVAPIALIWTLILAFTYFNVTGATFAENVKTYDALLWKGIKEGLKIVLMVFGAFVILNILRETGAIEEVKNTIARISDDRRVQVVIIGMMLPIFLEGAAGAGAPAAIAAPFLVALGFDPVTSIALALLGDATPCSWGGAGLTTINGGAALVDAGISTVALNSAMVGRIHMFGVLIIPFLMIAMTFGKKGFRGLLPYLFFAGITTSATMFVLSNFVGAEVTSMGTGIISILLSVLYVKLIGVKTPEEYHNKHIAAAVGRFYPAAAVLIGASGSFVTARRRLEHHVRRHARSGRERPRHEPHHHLRRAERRCLPRQPHLPEQHRGRLRHRRRDRQRERRHEAHAPRLRGDPRGVHDAHDALYLRALPQLRGLNRIKTYSIYNLKGCLLS